MRSLAWDRHFIIGHEQIQTQTDRISYFFLSCISSKSSNLSSRLSVGAECPPTNTLRKHFKGMRKQFSIYLLGHLAIRISIFYSRHGFVRIHSCISDGNEATLICICRYAGWSSLALHAINNKASKMQRKYIWSMTFYHSLMFTKGSVITLSTRNLSLSIA